MEQEVLVALVAFAFVSSVTPGPNNLMLMASGTNFGIARTVPHMLGVGIGFSVMVALVGAGLMQVFDAWPVSHTILRVVSVFYLGWLAWKVATARPPEGADAANQGKPFTFLQAAAFQWVNPKAWAMALTAISAYTPEHHPIGSVLVVALAFGIVNIPSISIWVVIGSQLRRLLRDPLRLRLFNWAMAVLLLGSLYPVLFN